MKGAMQIVKEIFMEQRFASRKDQIYPVKQSVKYRAELRRNLAASVLSNYIIYAMFFSIISLILFMDNSFSGLVLFQVISLSVYSYILVFSAYTCISFTEYINKTPSGGILRILPIRKPHLYIFLSWFIYTGSMGLFLIIPGSILFYIHGGPPSYIPLQVICSLTCIFTGFSLGYLISASRNQGRLTSGMKTRNIVRNIAIATLFLLFYTGISELSSLNISGTILSPNPIILVLPIISFSQLFSTGLHTTQMIVTVTACLSYLILSIFLIDRSGKFAFSRSNEGKVSGRSRRVEEVKLKRREVHGYIFSSLVKDINLVFRESLASLLVFTPLYLLFPFVLSISLSLRDSSVSTEYFMVFITMVSIISSASYVMAFLSSESRGFLYLRILLPAETDMVKTKTLNGTVIFSIISIPLIVYASLALNISYIMMLGIIMASISTFLTSCLISSTIIVHRIRNLETIRGISSLGSPFKLLLAFSLSSLVPVSLTILSIIITIYLNAGYEFLTSIWDIITFSGLLAVFTKSVILKSSRTMRKKNLNGRYA